MPPVLPAAALGLAGLAALLPTALQPRPGEAAIAVFPPGHSAAEALQAAVAAGWQPVAALRGNVLLARPATGSRSLEGALLVMDAGSLRGCGEGDA